jgi:hypothetical protein
MRDADKERAASMGAAAILDSYNSILGDGEQVQTDLSRANARLESNVRKSSTPSSPRVHDENAPTPSQSSASTQQHHSQSKSKSSDLPAFVLRAQREVAQADYIRNHDGTAFDHPLHMLKGDGAIRASRPWHSAHAANTETLSRRANTQAPQDKRQSAAPSTSARSPPVAPTSVATVTPASLQSLIASAVRKALSASNKNSKDGPSSQTVRAWEQYLSKAKQAREILATAPAPGAPRDLRTAQVDVLQKRVKLAEHLLARVNAARTQASAAAAAAAPAAASALAATARAPNSRARIYREMLRQGLIAPTDDSEQDDARFNARLTQKAKVEGRSLFAKEEQHLSQETDSIFGPNPGDATGGGGGGRAVAHRGRGAAAVGGGGAMQSLSQAAPEVGARRAAAAAAQSEAAARAKAAAKAEVKALHDQIDGLVRKVRTASARGGVGVGEWGGGDLGWGGEGFSYRPSAHPSPDSGGTRWCGRAGAQSVARGATGRRCACCMRCADAPGVAGADADAPARCRPVRPQPSLRRCALAPASPRCARAHAAGLCSGSIS